MLIEPQFRTKFADAVWGTMERLSRMAAFESALASAQAKVGLIPRSAAKTITQICNGPLPKASNVYEEAIVAGNPAIPFLKILTVSVNAKDSGATAYVHFGSTSQDLIDSAHMMALTKIADALDASLQQVASELRRLTTTHAETPMVSRTLLQQATPITFGLKAGLWGTAITQARQQLKVARINDMAVQLGGSNGALSAMAPHGPKVRADVAAQLGLADPGYCWHTLRSRVLTISAVLAVVVGVTAKIAGDCLLMMQTEVGEVQESFPGESSAMPHKKNPVHALVPVAALPLVATHLATLAGSQMHAHERAPGSWHTEWITLPVLTCLTLASVERVKEMISGLKINIPQMRANLALTRGTLAAEELVTTLAAGIARDEAHNLVDDLLKQSQNNNFSETVRSNSKVSELLTKEKIAEILGYKQTLTAAAREAQRLAKTINDV
ncbi:MAG: 3-carboxy-cis,cis-muconate cycloisomerase [Alphaproteobacteria bacterium MarineAlpha9_Bin7]|nr:MAG: 3-carboxy-cis,cis-muconate cycloisomerase [Alphaproteobacteria bacterium MarineAlpha9_Bin7]